MNANLGPMYVPNIGHIRQSRMNAGLGRQVLTFMLEWLYGRPLDPSCPKRRGADGRAR